MISNRVDVPVELVHFITTGSRFIIAGHKEPDGDCVGSQLTLLSVLRRLGKEAIVCSAGPFKRSEIKNYLKQFTPEITDYHKQNAKLIIIDCSNRERLGDLEESLEGLPTAIIDHHLPSENLSSSDEAPVYLDSNSPACTLLIYKLITALSLEPTTDEAKLLLFGLCTDSGFFRHLTGESDYVFEYVAQLLRFGGNPRETYQDITGGKSLQSRILLGRILSRIESYFDGKLLISYETLEETKTFGFESRDSDTLNQLMQSVSGVQAIIIIRQECADNCTVSLRSANTIDVSKIAASFGGGGHKNAAGLTMEGSITNVKEILLNSFKKLSIST